MATSKSQAKREAVQKAGATGKSTVVLNAEGSVVRTYSAKEHGPKHAALAKEFAANPTNVQRHGELTVK